jgi:hypothetical protein
MFDRFEQFIFGDFLFGKFLQQIGLHQNPTSNCSAAAA